MIVIVLHTLSAGEYLNRSSRDMKGNSLIVQSEQRTDGINVSVPHMFITSQRRRSFSSVCVFVLLKTEKLKLKNFVLIIIKLLH